MLKETLTADGDTGTIILSRGDHILEAQGTFGGGAVQLKSNRGLGFIDIPDVSLTADGQVLFSIPDSVTVKASLSGATSPDLTLIVR